MFVVVFKCRFYDNEGKEEKRLSKFDLCCLSDSEDVLNPREIKKRGARPTAATYLLLIRGKRPLPCNIRVFTLILLAKNTF